MSDVTRQFRELYSEHSSWLRGCLVRRYGAQEADDILQDTWLRFVRYHAKAAIKRPQGLLLTIAANLVNDRARTRRRDTKMVQSQRAVADGYAASQAEELFAKELILSLPQPLRDVFVLSRFGGLTNRQIAEQLGISPKTVEWRMTKALAHCAAQFRR